MFWDTGANSGNSSYKLKICTAVSVFITEILFSSLH